MYHRAREDHRTHDERMDDLERELGYARGDIQALRKDIRAILIVVSSMAGIELSVYLVRTGWF